MIQIRVEKEILGTFEKIIKSMEKNPIKAAQNVAQYVKLQAQFNAPKKSGGLISGIKVINQKKGARVIAYDPQKRVDGDMLALWANRNVAFHYKNIRGKRTRAFRLGPKGVYVVYGDKNVKSKSGKPIRWTGKFKGTDGYFSLAVKEGKRIFGKKMTEAVKYALAGQQI
jgi:hypothetical protein